MRTIHCPVSKTITIAEFLTSLYFKLGVDHAWQANKKTRWSEKQAQSYLTSVLSGMDANPMILVDVKACRDLAVTDWRKQDEDYFNEWLEQGCDFLVLDGNNRRINLKAFADGAFGFIEDTYDLKSGSPIKLDERSSKYSNLPEPIRKVFMEHTLKLEIYTDLTRDGCSQLFVNANNGVPLNPAEIRNAYTSNVANTIRQLAEEYAHFFRCGEKGDFEFHNNWMKASEFNRRGVDHFIAHMLYSWSLSEPDKPTNDQLLSMYLMNSEMNKTVRKFEVQFKRFAKEILSDKALRDLRINSMWDLWWVWKERVKDGYVLKKNTSIVEDYVDKIGAIRENRDFPAPENANWTSPTKYWKNLLAGRQTANNICRNTVVLEALDNFDEYFRKQTKRDSGQVASNTTLLNAAVRDKFMTPEGKSIPRGSLFSGQIEKGHIISDKNLRDAGLSSDVSVENTAPQYRTDNRKLGSKNIEKKKKESVSA